MVLYYCFGEDDIEMWVVILRVPGFPYFFSVSLDGSDWLYIMTHGTT